MMVAQDLPEMGIRRPVHILNKQGSPMIDDLPHDSATMQVPSLTPRLGMKVARILRVQQNLEETVLSRAVARSPQSPRTRLE
jgi:hypothetical protein